MPLSRAEPRNLLHLRDIQLRGYAREDGLVDIEARMTDTKSYSWGNRDRGGIQSGEPLHDMWMRVTLGPDMVIHAAEAAMDATPHQVCPGVAPNFARLAGLRIGKGFLKAAMERLAGIEGCTHLRELLQPIATVAVQTMFSLQHGRRKEDAEGERAVPAFLVNTCYAYDEHGPVVARGKAEAAL